MAKYDEPNRAEIHENKPRWVGKSRLSEETAIQQRVRMNNGKENVSWANRFGAACSLLVIGIGALGLWSWAAGVGELFTPVPQQIPMAPSTAGLMILIGVSYCSAVDNS